MSKIKVLLIQNYIAHYNLPIYNYLGENIDIDLTIAHFGKQILDPNNNFEERLLTIRKIGPLYLIEGNLLSYCNKFDVVIALGDIHFLNLMMLGKKKNRTFKLVFWGIGVSASYKKKMGEDRKWDFIRFYFMKDADALLFYSSYPIKRYLQHGFSDDILFVANNTVEVIQKLNSIGLKNSILFIGTLYKEKGIYDLLFAYRSAFQINNSLPDLNIIGGGTEFESIIKWTKKNALDHKILLHGVIYDDLVLETYFQSAICTISPSQAGLSVLKSMGYGVPFVTRFDSITGGERLNIINNENGIIYNNNSELINILCQLEKEKDKYKRMGENAANYYQKFRRPEHMVQGFLDVIKYVYYK